MTGDDGKKEIGTAPAEPVVPIALDAMLTSRMMALSEALRQRRLAIMAEEGLGEGHDRFLLMLHANDGIPMGGLAQASGISASSATKLAIKLEEKGLLRRESSRLDSRQNHAFLTDAGRLLAERLMTSFSQMDAGIVGIMKDKDADRLVKLLDRLEVAMEGRDPATALKPRKAGKRPAAKSAPSAGKKKKGKKAKKKS